MPHPPLINLTAPRLLAFLVLTLPAVDGCTSERVEESGGWRGIRETVENVTTVRTLSGSVWGTKARLVEEASIGVESGDEAYLLGIVEGITVGNDCIYVLDTQVPTIRVYDLQGRHARNIGRSGEGPGEFVRPRSIAIHPVDGRLFVRDGRGRRINVYSPAGDFMLRWPLQTMLSVGRQMHFRDDGTLLSPTVLNPFIPIEEWVEGIVGYGPEGATGNTIVVPKYDFKPWQVISYEEVGGMNATPVPFSPDVVWAFGPNGILASGISSSYRLEIRFPDNRIIVIERDFEPVPVHSDEKEWWREEIIASMRLAQAGWVWNGPAIPQTKPAYDGLLIDITGRIWVRRPGVGIRRAGREEDPYKNPINSYLNPYWEDAVVVDVFDFDGCYLGEVQLPDGFQFRRTPFSPEPYIRGETVVALFEGEDGVPYVKRYRLVEGEL